MNPIITIAGCGPGGPEYVTPAVRQAVGNADVIVGASRLLDIFPDHKGEKIPVGIDIDAVLRAIEDRCATRKVVVLVTGDPGLCSLARPVIRRFGKACCRVIPGISTIQAAFAAIGEDWLDTHIIDAHGNRPEVNPTTLAKNEKIAILLGNAAAVDWAARLIRAAGDSYRVVLCEDLTLPGEKIQELVPGQLEKMTVSSRSILLCLRRTA